MTRLFEFLIGLVRIKLSALYLGVRGVGLIDQLTFMSQMTANFTLLSMGEALVKQISESSHKEDISNILCSALKSFLLMIIVFMSISLFILILFKDIIAPLVFGEGDILTIYLVAIACIPLLVLNSIPFSILKAFKGVAYIAKARMIIAAINILILVPFIIIMGIDGAVIYVFISYVTTISINFYFANTVYLKHYDITSTKVFTAEILSSHIKELFIFSGFGVTVGLFLIISEMLIRSVIVVNIGLEGIGLYSPVIMWASILTGVMLPSFSTYLFPRFCEIGKNGNPTPLINSGLRIGSFALAFFIFLGLPFKDLFIALFYSHKFSGASEFVPYHFLGLIFYVWWYVLSQCLTPMGKIKQHGILLLLMYTMNYLIVYILFDELGLYAYMLKFIIPPFIFFIVYFVYCNYKMRFSISKDNIFLMIYIFLATLVIVAIDYFNNYGFSYILGVLLLCGVYFFLTLKEKSFIRHWVRKNFNFLH